jgi:asparagine synthase (glutamine-hydrolysing)
MCGIAGVLDFESGRAWEGLVLKMNGIQRHRGPDDNGIYVDDHISLGHTRLSIIDVSDMGHQPMQIGNWVIAFNGEIYNYIELRKDLESLGAGPFKSKSDTEVLLWAYIIWGVKCLEKLNGMFAFVIWDSVKQKLFCARDRLGIKPFYYCDNDKRFVFASEIKTLLLYHRAEPNHKVLQQYLIQGSYGLPDETFFKGVKALPPGHYLEIGNSGFSIHQYWGKGFNNDKFDNEEVVIEQYLSLMLDSIRLRLRSDVPVGLNVSGGLDSSVLLGVIDYYYKHKSRFEVYTYTCNDPQYDECQFAETLIEKTNHKWNKCIFGQNEFYDSLKRMQWFLDEPFGGLPTLAYSNIFREARRNNTLVLLCGEGMDEQWGGYDYYENVNNSKIENTSVVQGTQNPLMKEVLLEDFVKTYDPIIYSAPFQTNIDNLKYRDMIFTKIPRSLRFSDRISMAYGTELRLPFLDYRIVEMSFRLPYDFMIRNRQRKYLLRKLAKNIFQSEVIDAQKRPLQTPQREWLRSAVWVEDILNSNSFKNRGIFDSDKVLKMYNMYREGRFDNSFFLWQWINLEIWLRTFMDG